MQRDDGLFAYWPGSKQVHGFASAYALWLLQIAHERGVEVPAEALERGRAALGRMVRADTMPAHADDRLMVIFGLDALARAGDATAADFDRAYAVRGELPVVGRVMLSMALHRAAPRDPRLVALVRGLSALLEERAGVARIVPPTGSARAGWDSSTRDDAIALMAMLQLMPDDPRIDKLARGVSASRRRGRWRTTQENAFALLAMSEYARTREASPPEHRVRAWIGPRSVIDAHVRGFEDGPRTGALGLDALGAAGVRTSDTRVVLRRAGHGRVHWRVGVRWTEAAPQPRAQGLGIRTWIIDTQGNRVTEMIAGRRYRVHVRIDSSTPQEFIAVEVPLPAGVDAVPRDLGHGIAARAAGTIENATLSHMELRADRALLFFDELEPGTTEQEIAVIATSKGSYAVPGATAEAMYEPETRARGVASRIEIVDGAR